MLERFLDRVEFSSYDDFMQNFHINVPERFNIAYDVVDEWARIAPDKKALMWTNSIPVTSSPVLPSLSDPATFHPPPPPPPRHTPTPRALC